MSKKQAPLTLAILLIFSAVGMSQPTWTLDPFGKEKKPQQYEEKKLGSEKTAEKKFTTFRKFVQNNVTHYNYYFNANNKLRGVLERAKLDHKDDFSRLLTFYPFTLEATSAQKVELDSVIYKSTAGILLHDLRNDWVDNLYLLIGQSYYLRNELDSAALTFQFINYNLFPRKKNEDDNRVVGTNNAASSSIISIADKEKRNIVQKALTEPPSRNDALIWLVRTLTEQKQFGDAAGIINILQQDPNLPKRLRDDLSEVTAYWFYTQENYDSAAVHLENALSNAATKQDRARWEFLLGQMYEMGGHFDKASGYYKRSARRTVDPVMDIHARLNDAKMYRETGNEKELRNSIERLLKMAKRDRYEAYRDIIYYSAAQITQQIPDTNTSINYYLRSVKYNENNQPYRTRAFLQLANIAYDRRDYRSAFAYYDSIRIDVASIDKQDFDIVERRNALEKVVSFIETIEREDSLQRIAAMPEAEREDFLRKLLRNLRKEQGLKDDDAFTGNSLITFNNQKNASMDLFASDARGEWYFYNNQMKTRGFQEFRAKWGDRPNADNWRRRSATDAAVRNQVISPVDSAISVNTNTPGLSYETLLNDIPLTPVLIDSSNNTIKRNLLELAQQFAFVLEDHEEAIKTYEDYMNRFPGDHANGEVYMGLYYSYNKLGNTAKANHYKDLLLTGYAASEAAGKLLNPQLNDPEKRDPAATQAYADIYNDFIAGRFEDAFRKKNSADSLYGQHYWSPQLLYIEAIHHIRERNDSVAITTLNNIIALYPESPLKAKAENLVSVLRRRSEIESYLTNLEITREEEEVAMISGDKPVVVAPKPQPKIENRGVEPSGIITRPPADSVLRPLPGRAAGGFTINPEEQHMVMLVMDNVDGVYVNEARNAFVRFNRERYYNQPITITRDDIEPGKPVLLFSSFEDAEAALRYFDAVKKAAPTEISWLQPGKYSFYIISEPNLQILKSGKDLNGYKTLLNQNFNNRF